MIGPEKVAQVTALAAVGDHDELRLVIGDLTPAERADLETAVLGVVYFLRELAGAGSAPPST